MDDEQRARKDDRPPELGGMSLAEVGLAYKSRLLAPRSEPAASVVNFYLRHSGLERERGISKDIITFPLSFCPTAAEISLSLEASGAQLGQAETSHNEYNQEAGWEHGHSWSPGLSTSCIVDHAERPETFRIQR